MWQDRKSHKTTGTKGDMILGKLLPSSKPQFSSLIEIKGWPLPSFFLSNNMKVNKTTHGKGLVLDAAEKRLSVLQSRHGHGEYTQTTDTYCCSVTKLGLTLCDPMDCSTPGFPISPISQSLLKFMPIESVITQ